MILGKILLNILNLLAHLLDEDFQFHGDFCGFHRHRFGAQGIGLAV